MEITCKECGQKVQLGGPVLAMPRPLLALMSLRNIRKATGLPWHICMAINMGAEKPFEKKILKVLNEKMCCPNPSCGNKNWKTN